MKGLYGESILRGQVLVQLSEEVMKVGDPNFFSAQGDNCEVRMSNEMRNYIHVSGQIIAPHKTSPQMMV